MNLGAIIERGFDRLKTGPDPLDDLPAPNLKFSLPPVAPVAPRRNGPAQPADLKPRERQVLIGLFEEKCNKQIAADLAISVKTVEKHRSNLYRKLGVHHTTAAILWAVRHGLVSLADCANLSPVDPKPAQPGSNAEIENNFRYHPPQGDQPQRYEALRAKGKELAQLITELCPGSRERSLAMTNLEQTVMWANASIARTPVPDA